MVVILHFALLHEFGSNNLQGISAKNDFLPFVPYYGVKDAFSAFVVFILLFIFIM